MKKIVNVLLIILLSIFFYDISEAAEYNSDNKVNGKGSITIVDSLGKNQSKIMDEDIENKISSKYLPRTNEVSNDYLVICGLLIFTLVTYLLYKKNILRREVEWIKK